MQVALLEQHQGERTFAVIFDKGDEPKAGLTQFAQEAGVSAAHFTAVGAFSRATLGYFDRNRKDYLPLRIDEQVEVLSFIGDVALKPDGSPEIHAHVVVGRADGTTRGGHLLQAEVWPTLEVVVTDAPRHLKRTHDPDSGLALIDLKASMADPRSAT